MRVHGILVVWGVAAASIGFAETPLDDGKDRTSEAGAFAQRLLDLAKDSNSRFEALKSVRDLRIPDPEKVLARVWGESTAKRMIERGTMWDGDGNVDLRVMDLADFAAHGAKLSVERVLEAASEKTPRVVSDALPAMKERVPIYVVTMDYTDGSARKRSGPLLYLMFVGGAFRNCGPLEEAAPVTRRCLTRLKQAGIYLALFELKHKEAPVELDEICTVTLCQDARGTYCVLDQIGDHRYEYLFPFNGESTPGESIVAFDPDAHPDGLRAFLDYAGKVASLPEAEFQARLKAQLKRDLPEIEKASAAERAHLEDTDARVRVKSARRLAGLEALRARAANVLSGK
jgi:hypothetical protein